MDHTQYDWFGSSGYTQHSPNPGTTDTRHYRHPTLPTPKLLIHPTPNAPNAPDTTLPKPPMLIAAGLDLMGLGNGLGESQLAVGSR